MQRSEHDGDEAGHDYALRHQQHEPILVTAVAGIESAAPMRNMAAD
jgi:hypothetical protein